MAFDFGQYPVHEADRPDGLPGNGWGQGVGVQIGRPSAG